MCAKIYGMWGENMDNIKDTIRLMVKGLFYPDNKLSLIPNWVSASRAICGLIIPIMVFSGVSFEVLFGTIFYAAISDFLDGRLARILVREETPEGAMLDAISDKIFAILLMSFLIPFINTLAINLVLEGVIAVINGKILATGRTPKSNFIGKIKTWPLFAALGFSYLSLSLSNMGMDMSTLMNIASGLSLVSIPLEVASTKGYLDTYMNKDNYSLEEPDVSYEVQISDDEKDASKENNNDKTFSIALDKDKNIQAMVFECPTLEDEEKLEIGKQKKIEF